MMSSNVTAIRGALTRKIHRQPARVTSSPPASGPAIAAIPPHAVHEPMAAPRSSSAKVAMITASAAGVSRAPITPCTARAMISVTPLGATAHNNEANPKPATPRVKIRFSPNTSPSEPPTRISAPSISAYALTTHCCTVNPPPRSRLMAGSATLTIVASSMATLEPRMHAANVKRLTRAEDSDGDIFPRLREAPNWP